jgi:glycosyltransferase involved in cell wall biosynthesis
MTISVVIPAFNCARTIRMTLDSVLGQTRRADEILVLNDGSTDETLKMLKTYEPRVTVFTRENRGVSPTRNELCARAKGDLIAFLDSDDLWHPAYLETQEQLALRFPQAVAFFLRNEGFFGSGSHTWRNAVVDWSSAELIQPAGFLTRCRKFGLFALPSACCVPKALLSKLDEPFRGPYAEDFYFFHRLALLGPVAYVPAPLMGYRMRADSASANELRMRESEIHGLESLEPVFHKSRNSALLQSFGVSYAVRRRQYAKLLMGNGRAREAREQLRCSFAHSRRPSSWAKSLSLLVSTYFPPRFQPSWPAHQRPASASTRT